MLSLVRSPTSGCSEYSVSHFSIAEELQRRWAKAEDDPFEDCLDTVEAARELNIHPQSMRRLSKQNRIPARLYGAKYLMESDQLLMFESHYDPRPGRKRSPRLL